MRTLGVMLAACIPLGVFLVVFFSVKRPTYQELPSSRVTLTWDHASGIVERYEVIDLLQNRVLAVSHDALNRATLHLLPGKYVLGVRNCVKKACSEVSNTLAVRVRKEQ